MEPCDLPRFSGPAVMLDGHGRAVEPDFVESRMVVAEMARDQGGPGLMQSCSGTSFGRYDHAA